MKTRVRTTYLFAGGIALAAILLIVGVFDQAGYVFSGPYIVKGATITIERALPESDVFVNNRNVGRTDADGVVTVTGVAPGATQLIVSRDDVWPWLLSFESAPGAELRFRPLQVAKRITPTVLASDDAARQRAASLVAQYREPTRNEPLARDGVRVWVEGTSLFAQTADGAMRTVLSSKYPLRTVAWYADRDDAVVVASRDSVFALDLYQSEVRNFQPIYTGTAPAAIADPDDPRVLFVRDGARYLRIEL